MEHDGTRANSTGNGEYDFATTGSTEKNRAHEGLTRSDAAIG